MTQLLGSPRRRRWTLLSLVAVSTALLQTDLLASTSDSAHYGSFDVGAGTFAPTPPSAHRAQVAEVSAGECGTFFDDIAFGPYADTFDLDTGTSSTFTAYNDVCARNSGNVAADLYVSFDPTTFFSVEEAGCSPNEAEAGDADCSASTDQGELADILVLRLTVMPTSTFSCPTPDGTVIDVPFTSAATTPVTIVEDVPPGYLCEFDFQPVLVAGATETQKLLAQTDHVQWQLVFTTQDA